jgi:DNA-binding XRE family transcriptional regulator
MGFLALRSAPHNNMAGGRGGFPGDGPTHKSPRLAASALTPSMTPAQCRAARALLGWSQDELARNAGISRSSVAQFELELRQGQNRDQLQIALEDAGIEFTNGQRPGVKMR